MLHKKNTCGATIIKSSLILVLYLMGSSFIPCALADDVTLGDISARLDDVEKRIKGENPAGDELATKEEIDRLTNLVKALTGRLEMLEMKTAGKTVAEGQADHSQEPAEETPKIAEATDVMQVDETEVEDLLANLGIPKASKDKPNSKEKLQETREKSTENAEKTAPTLNLAEKRPAKKSPTGPEKATKSEEAKPAGSEGKGNSRLKTGRDQLESAKAGNKEKANEAAATFAKAYKENPKGNAGAEALLGLAEAMAFKDKKKSCTVLQKLQSDFSSNKPISEKAAALNKKYKCS